MSIQPQILQARRYSGVEDLLLPTSLNVQLLDLHHFWHVKTLFSSRSSAQKRIAAARATLSLIGPEDYLGALARDH